MSLSHCFTLLSTAACCHRSYQASFQNISRWNEQISKHADKVTVHVVGQYCCMYKQYIYMYLYIIDFVQTCIILCNSIFRSVGVGRFIEHSALVGCATSSCWQQGRVPTHDEAPCFWFVRRQMRKTSPWQLEGVKNLQRSQLPRCLTMEPLYSDFVRGMAYLSLRQAHGLERTSIRHQHSDCFAQLWKFVANMVFDFYQC